MFRLLQINCAKSFLGAAKHYAEVLVGHPGFLQNLSPRLFFQIERAQYAAIAVGELVQALGDGLAEF
jgi:hypothetical protein